MSRNGPSRYAQVDRDVGTRAVVPTSLRPASMGLHEGVGEDGRRFLHVRYPTPGAKNQLQSLNMSFLLEFPNLVRPASDAFYRWGVNRRPTSRRQQRKMLAMGWAPYLRERGLLEIGLEELNSARMADFVQWLNQTDTHGAARWVANTRRRMLDSVRFMIETLRDMSAYAHRLPYNVRVPRYQWPGASRRTKAAQIIDRPTLERLYRSCIDEVTRTMDQWRHGQDLLVLNRNRVPEKARTQADYKDLGICLAALEGLYPTIIPSLADIRTANKPLGNAAQYIHGHGMLSVYFQPTPRSLIPFVTLLSIITAFNLDSLLTLQRSACERRSLLGEERVVIRVAKPRASQHQQRSFHVDDAPDNPARILTFLERWTARIRPSAHPAERENVFLMVGARAHAQGVTGQFSTLWTNFKRFLTEHDLPWIALKQLRATSLDLIHDLFGGDMRAVLAASNHAHPQTFYSHYTSGSARVRNDERLAEVMAVRERWTQTHGQIDVRSRRSAEDLGAATPGWHCLDPYHSPMPGEWPGRLCRAYGACPACPHASVDLRSPEALVRLLQLRVAYEQARSTTDARRWLEGIAPRLERLLHYWLPQFADPLVQQAAARLSLPPLPPVT